jgi:hypothetical protein
MAREINTQKAAAIDDVEVEASLTLELYFKIIIMCIMNPFLFWIISISE